ncbi:unnamed protein product [Sphagnum compactum]
MHMGEDKDGSICCKTSVFKSYIRWDPSIQNVEDALSKNPVEWAEEDEDFSEEIQDSAGEIMVDADVVIVPLEKVNEK